MLTTYGRDFFTDLATGNETPKSRWYLALLTTIPPSDINGTDLAAYEVVDVSYERKEIGLADFSSSDGGISVTTVDITYASAVTDWGLVVGYAFTDANTEGEVAIVAEFPNPLDVLEGVQMLIPAGSLSISFQSVSVGSDD